jgi:hypothetical protein
MKISIIPNHQTLRTCLIGAVATLMTLLPWRSLAQSDSTQNTLNIGINFLTHGESCGGGLPKTTDSKKAPQEERSHFLLGRTRLNVDYSRPGLQTHAVIQNKSVWGMSGNQSLNLFEGWAKMTAKNGLFAQVGRVALTYDDERIIGPNDFAMAAQSHDVVKVGFEGKGHKVHVILGYNQNASNVYSGTYYENGAQAYKTMRTVWYHYDIPKFPLGVSLLFMDVGLQAGKNDTTAWDYKVNNPRTEYQKIYGGYVNFHPKYVTLEGSYYRQTGKIVDDDSKSAADVRAWMASVKATIEPTDKYGFELGFDYLSGDDYVPVIKKGGFGMVKHEVYKGFTPLYGSKNKFYGILDYFYESAYRSGFTPGLQNTFVGVHYKPFPQFTCSANYHYLATAIKLDRLDRTLGHSVELTTRYKFSNDIMLMASYTQMHGTDTADQLKQGESNKRSRWGWFSLVISPSLFTSKW